MSMVNISSSVFCMIIALALFSTATLIFFSNEHSPRLTNAMKFSGKLAFLYLEQPFIFLFNANAEGVVVDTRGTYDDVLAASYTGLKHSTAISLADTICDGELKP